MDLKERVKEYKKTILIMLIVSIASIPFSVLIAYFVGGGLTFGIGGFCSAIGVCFTCLYFPIATLIYGINMTKKWYPAKRDIVVGAICTALLLGIVIFVPLFSGVEYNGNFADEVTYKMYNKPLDETTYKGMSFRCYSGVGGDLVFYKEEDKETFNKLTLNARWNDHIPPEASYNMSKIALQRMKGFDCYYYSTASRGIAVINPNLNEPSSNPYTLHKLYAYNRKTGHIRFYAQAIY